VIAFPSLGQLGRFGNQLFQVAATLGCAFDHDDVARFPRADASAHLNLPDEAWSYAPVPGPLYEEPSFSFRPIPYLLKDPRTQCQHLRGYFQSERYFERHRGVIRHLLTPRKAAGVASEDAVSVHVRRGDYLKFPDVHPPCGMDYYLRALDLVGGRRAVVYSDDPAWCSQSFGGRADVAPPAPLIDHFCSMLRARHHVIANSSFSWWAAWLAEVPGSVVVAPRQWFGPRGPRDAADLLPQRWTRL
jgi:hypothetical protein